MYTPCSSISNSEQPCLAVLLTPSALGWACRHNDFHVGRANQRGILAGRIPSESPLIQRSESEGFNLRDSNDSWPAGSNARMLIRALDMVALDMVALDTVLAGVSKVEGGRRTGGRPRGQGHWVGHGCRHRLLANREFVEPKLVRSSTLPAGPSSSPSLTDGLGLCRGMDGYFKIIRGQNECGIETTVVRGSPTPIPPPAPPTAC